MRRLLAALALLCVAAGARGEETAQWPQIGNTPGGQRYSPLADIRADNVRRLKPKWTYRHGDFSKGNAVHGATAFEATPLMIDGTLYFCTPYNRIVALDAETGRERWTHDPKVDLRGVYAPVCRGVAYWRDASAAAGAACAERIYEATLDARLLAVDARSGKPCAGFGRDGGVDLRLGLGALREAEYYATSAPLLIDDLVVTGAFVKDGQRTNAPGGGIRAWDARSGALRWVWDSVPPTMKAVTAADIARGATLTPGTPNAWALLSSDPEHHLIFVPTGSAAPDHYGGAERRDLDYYGESVVALDARSGQSAWHFQTVHHDLWDYDLAAQPVTYLHRGRTPALIAATKLGFVFLLDRLSGRPLFPVEERPVPASTVPGEYVSPTQPFPTRPAPLHPLHLQRDALWGLTFWDKGKCQAAFDALDYRGVFTPPSLQGTLEYPGLGGGINWGSVSVDPVRRRMIVNLQVAPFVIRLVPRAQYRGAGDGSDLVGVNPQEGTPYVVERAPFLSPLKTPCVPPPWGRLVAIDLDSGERLWERPLGNLHGMAPFGDRFETGTPNSGGSMQTAGGLVFVAATMDRYLRAFDAADGRELWRDVLPYAGTAVPISYRVRAGGPQYLVIAAGGHGALGTEVGDAVVAYTLDGR
ncbi:pyrroloquinoline quinone-dependent dehydrogenase [Solimonas variicoloris]|uniref:pyrroloquinoline quinone-dependent dehydrogenase n=1 Tax=Solimonas variicoloris TaxID=254408 RepID=UPI000380ACF3|nr:pyrroloquinoline quinone-dependent dehydrogenase [Solimonas variicoloris]